MKNLSTKGMDANDASAYSQGYSDAQHRHGRRYANPYIAADEYNHNGHLHMRYKQGYEAGCKDADAPEIGHWKPEIGTPVWCKGTAGSPTGVMEYEGWAIVSCYFSQQDIRTTTIGVVSHNGFGEAITFNTDQYWVKQPPLERLEETLVDDENNEFTIGYGDIPDGEHITGYIRCFWIDHEKESFTLPLADVTLLFEALKRVTRYEG